MDTGQPNGYLPPMTVDLAKQKAAIALTKASIAIQNLSNEASALVLNEDHLPEISAFLAKTKKAEKIIGEEIDVIKKPYYDGWKACTTAAKESTDLIQSVAAPVSKKYNDMCNDIERRAREAEQKAAFEKQVKMGVESNILTFSSTIAAANTRQQLNDVERLINLEKSTSRASKYGELHQFAKDRYDEVLLPVLKDQKKKIEEKEELEKQLKAADHPEKADELQQLLDQKENEIIQNQVKVQENAMNSLNMPEPEAEVVLPEIKQSGGNIICEIVDEKKAFQKQRQLLNIELRTSDAKKLAYTLREAGSFGDKDELIFDGIKFTIERKWK